jgi:serine/threonine-protein kinase
VKVADFGVAALTNAAGQAISAGGTLGYMPPEQLRGEEVDARTDIWAFAALALQVLTGAVPFAASTAEDALAAIERSGLPPAGELGPGLTAGIDAVLASALAADPGKRPANVRTLADDLLANLGDPARGREALARMVGEIAAEEEETGEAAGGRPGLWNLLASRREIGSRVVSALASGWLAWSGMAAFGFAWPIAAVAVLFATAAGVFAPALGLGVGSALLAAGAFATNVWLGLLVTVVAGAWWLAVGRIRPGAGATPAFAPLAGVLRVSPAVPLLAGYFVDGVWAATAAGMMSGLVMVVTSVVSRSAELAGVSWPALVAPLAAPGSVAPPATGLMLRAAAVVAAWTVAAALSALGARRGTRPAAVLGMLGGALVVVGALGPWVTGGSRMDGSILVQIALASILVGVVVALGPPVSSGDAGDREARGRT